jgi:hypothetical protein
LWKHRRIIVERFCGPSSGRGGAKIVEELWKNCRKILCVLLRKIFLQLFHNYSLPPLPIEGPQNRSTILPQLFYNSSLCGRIWCILIGLEKNCRRNNRRKIVETFGEFRPSLCKMLVSLVFPLLWHYKLSTFGGVVCYRKLAAADVSAAVAALTAATRGASGKPAFFWRQSDCCKRPHQIRKSQPFPFLPCAFAALNCSVGTEKECYIY